MPLPIMVVSLPLLISSYRSPFVEAIATARKVLHCRFFHSDSTILQDKSIDTVMLTKYDLF